jgi:hypothetical protein
LPASRKLQCNSKIIFYVKVRHFLFRLNSIRRRPAYNAGCKMGTGNGVSETSEPPPLPLFLMPWWVIFGKKYARAHAMMAYRGSRGNAPFILNPGTQWG